MAVEADFLLGPLHVRPSTREAIVGSEVVALEPRVMQVLVALARKRGQVVSRFELIESCWNGRVVSDDAINRCIQVLRRLSERTGAFAILTVPRVGYRLDATGPGPQVAATQDAGVIERRHLTLLSCGLARRGEERSDPEEWVAAASIWRAMAQGAAEQFGAFVQIERDDRITAWFGYPVAQENAAERAVRAALLIARNTADIKPAQTGAGALPLIARIGIHADTVLVSRAQAEGITLSGEAADRAAQAMRNSPAGTIALTEAARALVPADYLTDVFPASDAGPELHVLRSTGLADEVAPRPASARFFGRDEELSLIDSRWRQALSGRGQVVSIHGEAGIGKSRLVGEFCNRALARDARRIVCAGDELASGIPFDAAARMIAGALGWDQHTPVDTRRHTILDSLAGDPAATAREAALLCALAGVANEAQRRQTDIQPHLRRCMLMEALTTWLLRLARKAPVVVVFEDLHWTDPSTLDWIAELVERVVDAPLLVLGTSRTGFEPVWPSRAHVVEIALSGLPDEAMADLLRDMAETPRPPAETAVLVDRAGGVPLFAEALARSPDGGRAGNAVPPTLEALLAARLEALGTARQTALAAAVIGREFSASAVREVVPGHSRLVEGDILRLRETGLVQRLPGKGAEAVYRFRHALIRDAAYGALPRARRRTMHAALAAALERSHGDPADLAHHWLGAGETARAMDAAQRAGERALAAHALTEARKHYALAVDLLVAQPDAGTRDAREAALSRDYALVLFQSLGTSREDLAKVTERSAALARRSGNLDVMAIAGCHALGGAMFRGDWDTAERIAEHLRELASANVPPASSGAAQLARSMAHYAGFAVAHNGGRLAEADREYRAWEDLNHDPCPAQSTILAMALGFGTLLAWQMGDLAELARRRLALGTLATQSDNPFLRAGAAMMDALTAVAMRDPVRAAASARLAIADAGDGEFSFFGGYARCALGWAEVRGGDARTGIATIEAGLAIKAERGSTNALAFCLTMLGEALSLDGRGEAALEAFEHALEASPFERVFRPHTLICRGEHHMRCGDHASARADLREAAELAREQGSLTGQLRAATGLALSRADGQEVDNLQILASRLGEQPAGNTLPDVVEARAIFVKSGV